MPSRVRLAIVAAALLMLGAAITRASEPEGVPMTAAEHLAAANAYDAEAKQDLEKAASHQLMADRYEHATVPQKGLAVPMTAMANHCRKLAESYKQAASEAGSLSKIHREAAKAAK